MRVWLKSLAICVALMAWAGPAAASNCISTADLPVSDDSAAMAAAIGRTTRDVAGRVVAPVMVNGQGPFRFIVDTGANRSVLSQGLSDQLGLVSIGAGEVHSVHDITPAPLVEVDSIQYGPVTLSARPLPLLQGAVLAGQQGLLGVDGMSGRRLQLDFARRCIEIFPTGRAPRLGMGWTTVRGQLRFGHLIVLRGRIREVDVNVLVDTGSDVTLANVALRDAVRARAPTVSSALEFARAYSAGAPIALEDVVALPSLDMGDLHVTDLLAYIGDFHIFELWQLHDQPAILIGMDVLRRTRAIAIDYDRASVSFRVRSQMSSMTYDGIGRTRR